jgi:hypothetical protein
MLSSPVVETDGAQFISFPDCLELKEKGTCGGKYVYPYPRVKPVHWNTVEVPGDFTGGVKPGMHLEKHGSLKKILWRRRRPAAGRWPSGTTPW